MKLFLLIGGFSGFTTTFLSGLSAGNDLSLVICQASVGTIVGAFLFKGLHLLLAHQLRQVALHEAEAKAQTAATEGAAAKN